MEVNATEEKATVENAALDIEKKAASLPQEVRERIPAIAGQEDLTRANNALAYIYKVSRRVDNIFDPIIETTRKAWKMALGKKKEVMEPISDAQDYTKGLIKRYNLELMRVKAEAEETERLRLKEIADKAEEKIQEAIQAEADGDDEKATEILEEAVVQAEEETKTAPVIIPEVKKMEAAIMRDHWVWKEVDFSLIPRELLLLDRAKINAIVMRDKEKTDIPGIEVYNDPVVSHRGERR